MGWNAKTGFLDDLFDRERQESPTLLQQPWQTAGQRGLYGIAETGAETLLNRAGSPYPNSLTTPYEQQGLQQLGDYLNQPLPTESSLFAGAQSELEKTFGGEYDPVGGTYYQAYRTAVMRELQEAKDRLAASTAARGGEQYFGGGLMKEQGNLEEGAVGTLAQELGRLYENERSRRLGAVPMAQDFLSYQEQAPLTRVAASQQYGSLPFQREYGEYIRQMQELGIPLEVAMNLVTNKPDYYQRGYEPSVFERYVLPLAQAAGPALGAYYGAQ